MPNDPFDNHFWHVQESSPDIWTSDRQSFIHNDAIPVPVHSHNDYWRQIPLFEALGSGCISVEADVYLKGGSDLLVGHKASGLRADRTLQSLYLEPLQRMIKAQNKNIAVDTWHGIFNKAPHQTIVLLVDHKTDGAATFDELHRQLQPLRDLNYLTYWNGTSKIIRPLTIVATGNAPFSSVLALNETHRDIFWDAKLEQLISSQDDFSVDPPIFFYNQSNSHYASTQWHNARLWPYTSAEWPRRQDDSTPRMRDVTDSQIGQARTRGLVSRYWDTPSGPPNLREIVLRVLNEVGVGILNMDDLGTVRDRARGFGKLQ